MQNSQVTGSAVNGIYCGGGELAVDGSQISTNVDGITVYGVAGSTTTLALTDVSTTDNDGNGIFVSGVDTGPVTFTADRLRISGNASGLWGQQNLAASTSLITNALIYGNAAGVVLLDANASLVNSTIADNTGRGFELGFSSDGLIENSILWQNAGGDVVPFSPSTVVVNSSILTSDAGLTGTLQTFADPTFTDAPGGDYTLLAGSPGIDAGDGTVTGLPSTDFDGNARISGGVVDLGAFEFQAAATASLSITSPTANQMLPLGTTDYALSVDITGHASPGHWHWQLDTPLAASGAAGGEHVEAGVTTASMTGLADGVSYTVYATLVDVNHDVLATPADDSVAFSVGVMPADYVRVVSTQGRAGTVATIPIEIYDVTGLAITAVDLDLLYDDQVLTPTSDVDGVTAVTTTGGVVPADWTVIQNMPTSGQLAISLAGNFSAPIPSGGLLVNVDFDVSATATAATTPPTAIEVTAVRLNEGAEPAAGVDGLFTILDVVYGDVTGDGTISAFDGSWVLEWVANDLIGTTIQFPIEIDAPTWASLPLLPPAALEVADVDDDGSIAAPDASDMLRKRVGLIDTFVAEGGAAAPVSDPGVLAYELRGSATSERPGARISVSLDTSAIHELTAGEFALNFDASLLRLVNATLQAGGVERPLHVQRKRDGRFAVAFASARPVTASDALIDVTFEARRVVANPTESAVHVTHLRLNRSVISTAFSYPFRIEPYRFALMPNYPNPFNPETWIPFELSQNADVTVRIYGLDGKIVRTLGLGHQPAGEYRARGSAAYWDGRTDIGERVASGLYVYELTAGDERAVRRTVISK